MNTKSPTPKPQRITLAKQISSLAREGTLFSAILASLAIEYERPLSATEFPFLGFYHFTHVQKLKQKESRDTFRSKPPTDPDYTEKRISKLLKMSEEIICKMFLDAVRNHDGKKIQEIAEAVWFFKGKVGVEPQLTDRMAARRSLLALVITMDRNGVNPPVQIRDVAEFVNIERFNTPEDGYSELRRLCKELSFPVAPSRKIRRK